MISKLISKLGYTRFIALSFIPVILLGTFLLCLPISSKTGEWTNFIDSLFTSVSATCVTGLVVFDTFTHWTVFGQIVILTMIQIGGLGLMTIITMISIFLRKKINMRERKMMMQSSGNTQIDGTLKLVKKIVGGTFIFEGIGAVLLAFRFCPQMGMLKGIYYSCFHAISAFCNAGFDLMGFRQPYSSLTYYTNDYYVNIIIMSLIVIGGIGFLTWEDIYTNKLHFRRYRMQSKVILITSAILIIVPALYFFFFDLNNLPIKQRILSSLFQSVTTRTAGFNTVDLTALQEPSVATMIVLMIIGGSPGSTAGGIKTTTVAVLIANSLATFGRKDSSHFFKRRIDNQVVKNASTILIMYLVLSFTGAVAISTAEKIPFLKCLFETSSAIGTVGLTLGITPELGLFSQLILILLMFCGRVGGLTLIYAAISNTKKNISKYPLEHITVG